MKIYLDIIWALNLLFDSLLLYLTAILLKRNFKVWRVILGGAIGSIIILLSITPLHVYSGHPIVKLLFSIIMILATFGYKRFGYFFKGLMTFYLTTFLIGGSLIGVHYFIKFDNGLTSTVLLSSIKGFGDPISWVFVLLGFPIAWHFSKKNMDSIEITKIQYDQIVSVKLTIADEFFECKGLIDSGNQLYDPITKVPVMFVSLANKQVREDLRQMAQDPESIIMGNVTISSEWEHKMRIIPYKVVGQEHKLIIAIKPDQLVIKKEEEIIEVEKGLVSFTLQQLSSDDAFQCIVHPKMMIGSSLKQTEKVS